MTIVSSIIFETPPAKPTYFEAPHDKPTYFKTPHDNKPTYFETPHDNKPTYSFGTYSMCSSVQPACMVGGCTFFINYYYYFISIFVYYISKIHADPKMWVINEN